MITILELAQAMGAEETEDGSISMAEFDRLGLPMMGGCQVCQASIAAYNACPTTTGNLSCTNCIGAEGYATVDQAAKACNLILPVKELDADQQQNADALAAIGVEYPIQKRYIVTESQLAAIGEALSDAQGFYEMFQGWEGTEEREANLVKIDALGWPTELVGGCEHWHRTCKVCGVWPVLEGWLSDEEYYCDPCGEACTTEFYTDAAGVEHTGLTMDQCWKLIEKDHPDNDFFFWTSWPLEDDDCTQDGPCDCRCWLCMKYPAKGLA
jgi:hypothetical protein